MYGMSAVQLSLFAGQSGHGRSAFDVLDTPDPELVARIRSELEATLTMARQAATLPWPDLTRATLAELRFNSIAGWLPDDEAAALRAAFAAEMTRLYAIADAAE
jgi:hypothetical protein